MLRKNGASSTNSTRCETPAPLLSPMQPVLKRERQKMTDIDHLGRLAFDYRRAKNAGTLAGQLHIEPLFDDVDDLVDHQSHGAALVRENQQRLRAVTFDLDVVAGRNEGHELAAILDERPPTRHFDPLDVNLFQSRDEREEHRLRLR